MKLPVKLYLWGLALTAFGSMFVYSNLNQISQGNTHVGGGLVFGGVLATAGSVLGLVGFATFMQRVLVQLEGRDRR